MQGNPRFSSFINVLAALTLSVQGLIASGPNPTDSAPAWSLPDVNGNLVHSTAFNGQAVVLNFWKMGSGSCRAEVSIRSALEERYANDGLVVIGVVLDGSGTSIKEFATSNGISFPVVAGDEAIVSAYGVNKCAGNLCC